MSGIDTETTGLHHMVAKPFLMSFGWLGHVYTLDMKNRDLVEDVFDVLKQSKYLFAHNAKFDYHMFIQYGIDEYQLSRYPWADSITVARLTNYADADVSMSLESLGQIYVDDTAKFAGKVIKDALHALNRDMRKFAKQNETEYVEANYEDVYKAKPNLMLNYAADDIVIMLKYLEKAMPILDTVDPGHVVFDRERKLISVVARMERVGILVDVNYAQEARKRFVALRDSHYNQLRELTGKTFTVGQHEFIKNLFRDKYEIIMFSCDEAALKKVYRSSSHEDAKQVSRLIIELRTIDKYISTYIDGKLADMVNGRSYTSINNSGAVSGRVSSNLQQQPKEAYADMDGKVVKNEDGTDLFHPRRMYIADPGTSLFFLDYSQMELRVQAYYTMLIMGGDPNLCRAYIPLNCKSILTDEVFDFKDPEMLKRWDSGEWVHLEDGKPWEKIDVHCVTTHNAFPDVPYVSLSNNELNPPEFKKKRKLGKVCNFLKNYQGGVGAIVEQLEVSEEVAKQLDQAYTKSFPGVADYQRWVRAQYQKYRYIENLYGRRYYMQDLKWSYRGANYLIQGGCADLVKLKEIQLDAMLQGTGIDMVLPIHDEIMFRVPIGKESWVKRIHACIEDVPEIPYIPMLSEIEMSQTSWADKGEWHYGENA